MKIKDRYQLNKKAKVNDELTCPSCGTKFVKTNYQQAFCKSKTGTKCKDKYWNTVTPTKRNNTTRISPANAAYYERHIAPLRRRRYVDLDFDGSWDAHYAYVEPCEWCGERSSNCRCIDI